MEEDRILNTSIPELHPARLSSMLKTSRIGVSILLCESVDSTNTVAAFLGAGGAPEGTIVIADCQRMGKGRKGRSWHSTRLGSLVFSMILRPSRSPESLTALLALAAASALDGLLPQATGVKWPNDIYIAGRKVAGILAETKDGTVVLGMGVDVNETAADFPPGLSQIAVSLRMAAGRIFDRGEVLSRVVGRFESAYSQWEKGDSKPLARELEGRLLWKGRSAVIQTGQGEVRGIVAGITEEGFLRMSTRSGERIFQSGDLALDPGGL